jgi:hypothetical protein
LELDSFWIGFIARFRDAPPGLRWLKVEPIFDGLRSERRFGELLRRVGLPTSSR